MIKHDRRLHLPPNPLQHLEDLRLHRDVERGGRLVGDQHLRVVGDRHRDHHPLAHAAGELMGKLARPLARLRDADDVEQLDRAFPRLLLSHRLVGLDHLDDLVADAVHRVQRRQRVLEDHRHPLAAHPVDDLPRRADELGPANRRRTLDAGRLREQAHQTEERHRLPGAGLPDDAEHLALADVEVDAADRLDVAEHRRERDPEVAQAQDRIRHRLPPRCSLGSVASRSPSPTKLIDQRQHQQRRAGEHDHPPVAGQHVLLRAADEVAERRLARAQLRARSRRSSASTRR